MSLRPPTGDSLMSSDDESEAEDILEKAIRTRLPKGSMSPDKERGRSPQRREDSTLRLNMTHPNPEAFGIEPQLQSPSPPSDNCECDQRLFLFPWSSCPQSTPPRCTP